MQVDFRRSTLQNLKQVQSSLQRLRCLGNPKARENLLAAIITSMDLLHNDLVLVLNQNFYLQVKMV
jgi:hypothetical protein